MTVERVLAFGAWDRGAGYPRGEALIEALRGVGVTVAECRFELPFPGAEKRRLLRSPWLWPGYWFALRRARRAACAELARRIRVERPELVLVPYPGHLVVRWARSVFDGPVVLDLFLSAYDTAVVDRRLCKPGSLLARCLRRMDRQACAVADKTLLDTAANVEFVADLVGLPRERFAAVHVSDPREPASAAPYVVPEPRTRLEVLFFGTGVPLHGLEHLLDAVAETEGVRLTLIGGAAADRARARVMPADRVRLLESFVDDARLRAELAATHLVAGVFGSSPKADRVVPFKVMQALAAGRPVLTARTRAACQQLREGVDALLVPPADPVAISRTLRRLVADPEGLADLATAARRRYEESFSLRATGAVLAEALGVSDPAGLESTPVGVS